MARAKFDPTKAAGAEPSLPLAGPGDTGSPAPSAVELKPLSVSQVAGLIKDVLETSLPSPLKVIGQVSNFSARQHWYFSLKDDQSVLSCAAWASATRRFGFTPRDGDEVIATGHVSHYGPQGRTQFYVSGLQPVGAGALDARFRAMCEELRGLGYFDDDRKKPLPLLPRRVAVVTSAAGAALQDVLATARKRCPAVSWLVVDVKVQGTDAAPEVAEAISRLDSASQRLGIDAILVTRGGGSMEDLWAFNERVVADAVHRCRLPVVAAIGHESDVTVIELVADLRAATPTQAAMHLVPSASELLQQVEHLRDRLQFVAQRRIESGRHRLTAIERHPAFRDPGAIIQLLHGRINEQHRVLAAAMDARLYAARARLESLHARWSAVSASSRAATLLAQLGLLEHRLRAASSAFLARVGSRLSELHHRLNALDPLAVLSRGFSYTTDLGGTVIRSIAQVRPGQPIRTHVSDGEIASRVESGTAALGRRRRLLAPSSLDQPGLFASSE